MPFTEDKTSFLFSKSRSGISPNSDQAFSDNSPIVTLPSFEPSDINLAWPAWNISAIKLIYTFIFLF